MHSVVGGGFHLLDHTMFWNHKLLGVPFPCRLRMPLTFVMLTAASFAQEADLTVSKDYGVSRRMVTQLPDDRGLFALREHDLAGMSVDDVKLLSLYVRLFTQPQGLADERVYEPHVQAAFKDLKRRGSSATPTLLKLARDNSDTRFEISLLLRIDQVEGMDVMPYVQYAREVLDSRASTVTSSLAEAVASLLLKKGNATDVELLNRVAEKRPYLAYTIKTAISRHAHHSSQ